MKDLNYQINCRYFNGYKPCGLSEDCNQNCMQRDIVLSRVLLIHLGAMGAVLRSTALLQALHQKHPRMHLTWVTQAPMQNLLKTDPLIDRILTTEPKDLLQLEALEFDFAYIIDKSLEATALLKKTKADQIFGFVADPHTGAILPANNEADELWTLGLSNEKKFFVNKKTENQLVHEALDLGEYKRNSYRLFLNETEKYDVINRNKRWSLDKKQPIIGFNTGCGPLMPAKKWSIDFHREVIESLLSRGYKNIVLLGGPEDEERNNLIGANLPVIRSSTQSGIRDGLISLAACDLIITGDSFGMHMAIALKKFIVAWFGPSCDHEIDLYDHGIKLKADVACGPCWKRQCQKEVMCYDKVGIERVLQAIEIGAFRYKKNNANETVTALENI